MFRISSFLLIIRLLQQTPTDCGCRRTSEGSVKVRPAAKAPLPDFSGSMRVFLAGPRISSTEVRPNPQARPEGR